METQVVETLNSGSRWHRWEPHVHAPGTVMNDQFKGSDAWEKYLAALENSEPKIKSVGITDYYNTETYEWVREAKRQGHLPDCDLIFPNIEMRLGIGTVKGKWVNLHLLVSPEAEDHLIELQRFLARFTFKAHGDSFCCSEDDLIRLGRRCNPALTSDYAALAHGSEQFKVSFDDLKTLYLESTWAKQNVLIAVAGSETDGTSGIRAAADTTLRQEVEKFAHIIFASSTAQREYWLGLRGVEEAEMREKYNGLKPCMHGCDAHETRTVGIPDGDRFSWIKGAIEFDSLRQACIDPEGRAYVGEESPMNAASSQVISKVKIQGARWASTPELALNPGLIAIIGAKGSGKTALADLIALGCDAISIPPNTASFLGRARELLHGATTRVEWEEGAAFERQLDASDYELLAENPRARYLSQHFVEELCSAQGVTDGLVREIERVVFESHPLSARDGAVEFSELLTLKADCHRQSRQAEEHALATLSEQIGVELEKMTLVDTITKQINEKKKLVAGFTTDRSKLVAKGSEDRIKRLAELATAAEKVRGFVRYFNLQEQCLTSLQMEVSNLRFYQAPESLRQAKEKYKASKFTPDEWNKFLLDYKGNVDESLEEHLLAARNAAKSWKGVPHIPNPDPNIALIADGEELDTLALTILETEIERLGKLVSVDKQTASKFSALSKRISEESEAVTRLSEKLLDCQSAKERVKSLVLDREAAYARVFDAIKAEQDVLSKLYHPLVTQLEEAEGSLKKLSFSVTRKVDIKNWADAGECLLDLRQKGPFKGRGSLRQLANQGLKEVWEKGSSAEVSLAMKQFLVEHLEDLKDVVPGVDQTAYRAWSKRFATWLYSTDHITLQYSIDYDGIDIRKLSPGTRGIVLLLLYLALDNEDYRPLIIDQPEENLDPKSIHDELVGLFLDAKKKRQVIMVTHNANLVINTDADQIIVAQAGIHSAGELPSMTYLSGGLENRRIREAVCNILEGGERAFQERARRLRVRLER